MPAKYIGVHVPTGKGLSYALRDAHTMGCTAVQVFTSSPRMWSAVPLTDEKVALFRKAVQDTKLDQLISHDTYLVNLCHADEAVAEKSQNTLREELFRSSALGIPYVVSHMGSQKALSHGEAILMVAERTKSLLAEMPDGVMLLMETTAGQGSALNSRFEELAMLLELCGFHPKLGVCLDSCHVFVAGYDIRTEETYGHTMSEFDRVVGIKNLKAIHLNDSKKGLGSHVDRHDNIGAGALGLETFSYFVNDPRLENIPMVVETPTENEGHEKDLKALRSLIIAE